MLLFRTNDLQVFGYTPLGNPRSKQQAIGACAKWRRRGRWRWFSAKLYWVRRDLRIGRGCGAVELTTWLTDARTGDRLSVKTFVRLKVGLGGKRNG